MTTSQLRENPPHCPFCFKLLDGFTSINCDGRPTAGALTVCYYCGGLLEFDAALQLHPISDEVYKSLPPAALESLNRAANIAREASNIKAKH